MTTPIRFDDGDAYERYMSGWSQLAGGIFLDWLALEPQLRWLDVGCGNGAFTELLAQRCSPASVHGIDPSAEQLAYARRRPALATAQLDQGDAMALPYPGGSFDAAIMPLVVFFVPDPAKGIAEMRRVVSPGGTVAAYAWDVTDGGFPYEALLAEIRALEIEVPMPPSAAASRLDNLQHLWSDAGLETVETQKIAVQHTFDSFEHFWTTALGVSSIKRTLANMAARGLAHLEERVRARLPADATGRVTCSARANAVKGRVPR